jgi:hypothetical protein
MLFPEYAPDTQFNPNINKELRWFLRIRLWCINLLSTTCGIKAIQQITANYNKLIPLENRRQMEILQTAPFTGDSSA